MIVTRDNLRHAAKTARGGDSRTKLLVNYDKVSKMYSVGTPGDRIRHRRYAGSRMLRSFTSIKAMWAERMWLWPPDDCWMLPDGGWGTNPPTTTLYPGDFVAFFEQDSGWNVGYISSVPENSPSYKVPDGGVVEVTSFSHNGIFTTVQALDDLISIFPLEGTSSAVIDACNAFYAELSTVKI